MRVNRQKLAMSIFILMCNKLKLTRVLNIHVVYSLIP